MSRVEELEAALREILDLEDWKQMSRAHEIARQALHEEGR